jgi:predicted HAD superfamily Cof-like phosphohydrolase
MTDKRQPSNHDDVKEFHRKFGVPVRERPQLLNEDEHLYRLRFLREELDEFHEAYEAGDLVKAFDALLDLAYVVHGTAIMMGLPWQEGWDHVQRANMMKRRVVNGAESKRGSELDVVKPDGWVGPEAGLLAALEKLGGEL